MLYYTILNFLKFLRHLGSVLEKNIWIFGMLGNNSHAPPPDGNPPPSSISPSPRYDILALVPMDCW